MKRAPRGSGRPVLPLSAVLLCAFVPGCAPSRGPGLELVRHPAIDLVPRPARVRPTGGAHSFAGPPVVVAGDPADEELVRLARHTARLLAAELGVPARAEGVADGRGAGGPREEGGGAGAAIEWAMGGGGAGEGDGTADGGLVRLTIDPSCPDSSTGAYRLVADEDGVRIVARGHAGIFYGVQTLRQLTRRAPPDGWSVPGVRIDDRPRFSWRGLHLDVARHFFPVPAVERVIDLAARYKLNRFHWHLTDDQGWRVEIERYPGLTEVGAFRDETVVAKSFDPYVGDGVPHGGFYTQDEIRDVVAYAAERYVTVIPEIEMPGHATAALAAYPELACTPGPFEVGTRWGVYEDVLCPHERTFEFLEGVLAEVIELFPGPWVHVGGDEVPKVRWRESEEAQAVMRREGLADEEELQGWFMARIGAFLERHGRRLVGWDEILEGGLPPGAVVMSWRGTEGGVTAARAGHDVVMSPTSHLYFDYYQGDPASEPLAQGGHTTLEDVYRFEPVPDELTAGDARHVLGPQANLWTEYVTTPEHLEYMLFPRLLALAEVAWSPRDARDWSDFEGRLPERLAALDRAGVSYRIPDVRGLDADGLTLDSTVTVELSSPLPEAAIHYTVDGSEPGPDTPRYASPFTLGLERPVRVRARLVLPNGRAGPVRDARFRRATLRPAEVVDDATLGPGLEYRYFAAEIASVEEVAAAGTPVATRTVGRVALQGTEREESFALRFAGLLRVPDDGIYRFTLLSDDGATLMIGDEVVVDHDGLHGATEMSGSVALRGGHHPIVVTYFQAGGGKALELFVTPPHGERVSVPPGWLRHAAGRDRGR